MNERIEQLWCQGTHAVMPKSNEYASVSAEEIKKFAELIVRECANIAYEYDAPKMSGPGMIIAGTIQEHFGVEE